MQCGTDHHHSDPNSSLVNSEWSLIFDIMSTYSIFPSQFFFEHCPWKNCKDQTIRDYVRSLGPWVSFRAKRIVFVFQRFKILIYWSRFKRLIYWSYHTIWHFPCFNLTNCYCKSSFDMSPILLLFKLKHN